MAGLFDAASTTVASTGQPSAKSDSDSQVRHLATIRASTYLRQVLSGHVDVHDALVVEAPRRSRLANPGSEHAGDQTWSPTTTTFRAVNAAAQRSDGRLDTVPLASLLQRRTSV